MEQRTWNYKKKKKKNRENNYDTMTLDLEQTYISLHKE